MYCLGIGHRTDRRGRACRESAGLARGGSVERLEQAIDERDLSLLDTAASLVGPEPFDPIDLRERLTPAGSRRPFELDDVADGCRRIELSFDGPGVDHLATLLDNRRQIDRRPVRCYVTGLLHELSMGDGQERFARLDLALDDRPVTEVLLREVRPTGMREEQFDPGIDANLASRSEEPSDYGRECLLETITPPGYFLVRALASIAVGI